MADLPRVISVTMSVVRAADGNFKVEYHYDRSLSGTNEALIRALFTVREWLSATASERRKTMAYKRLGAAPTMLGILEAEHSDNDRFAPPWSQVTTAQLRSVLSSRYYQPCIDFVVSVMAYDAPEIHERMAEYLERQKEQRERVRGEAEDRFLNFQQFPFPDLQKLLDDIDEELWTIGADAYWNFYSRLMNPDLHRDEEKWPGFFPIWDSEFSERERIAIEEIVISKLAKTRAPDYGRMCAYDHDNHEAHNVMVLKYPDAAKPGLDTMAEIDEFLDGYKEDSLGMFVEYAQSIMDAASRIARIELENLMRDEHARAAKARADEIAEAMRVKMESIAEVARTTRDSFKKIAERFGVLADEIRHLPRPLGVESDTPPPKKPERNVKRKKPHWDGGRSVDPRSITHGRSWADMTGAGVHTGKRAVKKGRR